MTLALNGIQATSMRLTTPHQGVWHADLMLDPALAPIPPVGPAIIKVGLSGALSGFVDDRASGRFGEKLRVIVKGGRGGWDKIVQARHWHNDAGVLSSVVLQSTAVEVGELLVQAIPRRLGVDFGRSKGPASRVLAGLDWYVDHSGTTIVGPRPHLPSPIDAELLSWDPRDQCATLKTGDLILPGMVLVNSTFGNATIRDVEQDFSSNGESTARAWCSTQAASRLGEAMRSLIREEAGVAFLRRYIYRVIDQGVDGRLVLQATKPFGPVPDMLAIPVNAGLPGMFSKVQPGSKVLVEFLEGDPSKPVVTGFDDALPITLRFDAGIGVQVGSETAAKPVACAPELLTWVAAVIAACAAHAPPITIPPISPSVASTKLVTE